MSWNNPPAPPAQRAATVCIRADNMEAGIAEILQKGDAVARAMARGIAAGLPQATHEWFKAEVERGRPTDAIQALIGLQLSTFSGIVGPALPEVVHPALVKLYSELLDDRLLAGMASAYADIHAPEARP